MRVLRYAWAVPYFLLSTAVLGASSMITGFFSGRLARAHARWWARGGIWAMGIDLRVEGLENLPSDGGGVIVASNHASAADIGAVLAGLPLDICWVAKAELLKVPFVGWHLRMVHIPVARKKAGNTSRFLDAGAKRIQDGASVTIFPEGTRNRGGSELLPFRSGAFRLAKASGRPIVPVAIIDSAKVWPPSERLPRAGRITMRLGAPIDPRRFEGDDLDPLARSTREAIEGLMP